MTTRQNARRNFKVNRPKILPLLNGASRLWFALGPVNRQANEKAIAWYFSSSGFPSNSFLTTGSITFCFPSDNGDSLTEPKLKRWIPGKNPRQLKLWPNSRVWSACLALRGAFCEIESAWGAKTQGKKPCQSTIEPAGGCVQSGCLTKHGWFSFIRNF